MAVDPDMEDLDPEEQSQVRYPISWAISAGVGIAIGGVFLFGSWPKAIFAGILWGVFDWLFWKTPAGRGLLKRKTDRRRSKR